MDSDVDLLEGLRAGDEDAFAALVSRYHPRLIRLAMTCVHGRELAEDVAQETWLAVVRGVDKFEGRSPLRSWLFQICINRARSASGREGRDVSVDPGEGVIERFDAAGGWLTPPEAWPDDEDELLARVHEAIEQLPDVQRQVLTLRDIEGLSSDETCQVLSVSNANQRVLLHRARARVRASVDAKVGRR